MSMASCAGVKAIEPSKPVIRGHTNPPWSIRFYLN
jgi:hypothetical protein